MLLRLKVIYSRQPLRTVIDRGENVRGGRKLHRFSVEACFGVYAERNIKRRSRATELTQRGEVRIEHRVIRKQRPQARDRGRRGNLNREILRRVEIVLLKRRAIRVYYDSWTEECSKAWLGDLKIVDPRSTASNRYTPASLLRVVRRMPVSRLVKATFAPLMIAPEESSTVPVTIPRLV